MTDPVVTNSSPGEEETSKAQGHCSSVQQKSYAAAVNKRPSMKKFEYEVSMKDGVPTIAVPKEVINDSVPLWEDFLVGRFPTQAPHVAKIHVIVNKIWTLGEKSIRIDVYEIDSTSVKFRIRDSSTRSRIVRRGMWNIAGLPMIVSKWSPIKEEAQPEVKMMPLWVTVKNVPHSMFSWDGLSFLTSPVGNPIRLHPETELCTNFEEAKVFVEVNLSQDVPKRFRFQIEYEEDVTVEFVYPWLPPKCTCCGKWGHLVDVCVIKPKSPLKVKETEVEEGEIVPVDSGNCSPVNSEVRTVTVNSGTKVADNQSSPLTGKDVSKRQDTPDKVSQQTNQAEGEGWSLVSPGKGCTSSGKTQGKPLEFGQVTILSSSRFSVLSEQEENSAKDESQTVALREELMQTELKTTVATVALTAGVEKNNVTETEKVSSLRATLPRISKSSHKVLSETSTQKARDTVPNASSRRNSKKHH